MTSDTFICDFVDKTLREVHNVTDEDWGAVRDLCCEKSDMFELAMMGGGAERYVVSLYRLLRDRRLEEQWAQSPAPEN